jgi:serine protease Do
MARTIALLIALMGLGVGVPLAARAARNDKSEAGSALRDLDRLSSGIQALAQQVSPAVVQVFSSSLAPAPSSGDVVGGLLSRQRGTGSGVIVDPSGYIVTNAHVVAGVNRVEVQLAQPRPGPPGKSAIKAPGMRYDAQIVGVDQESDLAVLKIAATSLPTLPFGDSDALRQGQVVLAVGSPYGLGGSFSMGVISAPVRQVEPEAPMIYLQTDADIHPGNSGGPLVDTQGRVIGINTFIIGSPDGDGVGFAAPSNIVSAVYKQIRENGRVRRGEIGARAQTITPELVRGLGLKRDWGVVISDVYPGGPAAVAGLRPGDVVLEMDGKEMENARQLNVNLYRRSAGDEVTLETDREGERKTLRVRLTERSGDLDRIAALTRPEEHLVEPLHILGLEVDATIASMRPMRDPWGVLVALSSGDAPPGGAPLLPGDVIRSIDRNTVRTLDDLRGALAQHKSGDWVVLYVERRGRMIYVPVEVP